MSKLLQLREKSQKTLKNRFLFLAFLFVISQPLFAGPTLHSNDIMVVGYNTDLDDQFAFIALADIPGNSIIFITDEGWDDNDFTFDDAEEAFQWTVAAGGITAGTIIRFTNESTTTLELKNSAHGTLLRVNGDSDMSFSAGDQLFIYQTANDSYDGTIQRLDASDAAEAGMIYAFNGDNSAPSTYGWLDAGSSHLSTSSQAPDNMTVVTTSGGDGNAFGLLTQLALKEVSANEYDNYRYDGPTTAATQTEWITRLHTTANWLADDVDTLGIYSGVLASDFSVTPVPVELTSFDAQLNENSVELNWETATEVNNYGFEIERQYRESELTSDWVNIGFVQGNGTTNSVHAYSFTDNGLLNAEELSYRLKQIDIDGASEYSKVATVQLTGITGVNDESVPVEFALLQNYPNPFNPTTIIKYQVASSQNVSLKIYNMLGQEVANLVNKIQNPGSYEIPFDASELTSGTYFYRLQAGNFVSVKKMVLIK